MFRRKFGKTTGGLVALKRSTYRDSKPKANIPPVLGFKPYGNTEMACLFIAVTNFGIFDQFQSGFTKKSP